MKPTISPVGDRAISIDFGQVIDPNINRHIRQTIERIKALQLEGIIELVPTYCALLVEYDAMRYSYSEICNKAIRTIDMKHLVFKFYITGSIITCNIQGNIICGIL